MRKRKATDKASMVERARANRARRCTMSNKNEKLYSFLLSFTFCLCRRGCNASGKKNGSFFHYDLPSRGGRWSIRETVVSIFQREQYKSELLQAAHCTVHIERTSFGNMLGISFGLWLQAAGCSAADIDNNTKLS